MHWDQVGAATDRWRLAWPLVPARRFPCMCGRTDGAEAVSANASNPLTLEAANFPAVRRRFVTTPEPFDAGAIVSSAMAAGARQTILARAHSDEAIGHLTSMGATIIVMGEREIARCMREHATVHTGDLPAPGAPALRHCPFVTAFRHCPRRCKIAGTCTWSPL